MSRVAVLSAWAERLETPRIRVPVTIGLTLALTALAWINRFQQDDAFISFRYARNLVEGHGLVFNPGEWVEGYTNFLWTVLMAGGISAGIDPVHWSMALGLVAFGAGLLALERLTAGMGAPPLSRWAIMVMTGANFTYSSYATGGLETSWTAAIMLLAVASSQGLADAPRPTSTQLLAFGALCAVGLLTRLDMAVLLALPLLRVGLLGWRRGEPRERLRIWLAAFAPVALPLAVWLGWKWNYYGTLLPNTWYAKQGAALSTNLVQGANYVWLFASSYLLVPALLLVAFARSLLGQRHARWLAGMLVSWLLYVIYVGGGFMEFRFMVPAIPLGAALLGFVLASRLRWTILQIAVIVFVLVGSIRHQSTFNFTRGVESIGLLEAHLTDIRQDWPGVGRALDLLTREDPTVRIALTPAGAIPDVSRLPTVDMLGLNDAYVARHGLRYNPQPGHHRLAPFRYLVDRQVHLLIGHPRLAPRDRPIPGAFLALERYGIRDADPSMLPREARVIEIPLDANRRTFAVYLTAHPLIDAAIERGDLHAWPLSR